MSIIKSAIGYFVKRVVYGILAFGATIVAHSICVSLCTSYASKRTETTA